MKKVLFFTVLIFINALSFGKKEHSGSGTVLETINNGKVIPHYLSKSFSNNERSKSIINVTSAANDLSKGLYSVTTSCDAITTFPFVENFSSSLSECWNEISTNTYGWTNSTTGGFDGNCIRFNSIYNSFGSQSLLQTPIMDFSSQSTMMLSFMWKNPTGGNFKVVLSTDGGTTFDIDLADNLIATSVYEELVIDLTAYSGPGFNNIVVGLEGTSNYGYGDAYIYVDNFMIQVTPTCFVPSGLNAENITSNSADLSWITGGASTWDIEILESTSVPTGVPTNENISSNPFSISSLEPQTEYVYYVRDYCGTGDVSLWTGPYIFTTNCAPITSLPFTESFNSASTTEECWTVLNANEDYDEWNLNYSYNTLEGDQCAGFNSNYNYGNNDDYLISPQITLSGNQRLKYNFRVTSSWDPENFEVVLSTTTNNAASFTTVLLENTQYTNTTYQENIIDLSAYSGDVYIAIHMPNDVNDGNYLLIDDITIEDIPSCIKPTDLNAENITANSADLSWVTGGASAWDLELGEAGFTATGIPTHANITANPYTALTLDSETDYEFYVRDNCGTGDESVWVGPYTFTTLISCPVPTELNVSAITINSAELGWTSGGTESQWNIEYGLSGFTLGEGTMLSTITTNPTAIESLTENTEYDFYVQAYCGIADESLWVGPYAFRTLCNAITDFPFVETFNSESTSEDCWSVINANEDYDAWNLDYAYNTFEGDQCAAFNSNYNYGNNDDYIVSPQLTLTGNQRFKFNFRAYYSWEVENFEVLLSTTNNEAESFTTVLLENAQYTNTTYQETIIDLSAYTGNVFIAIHMPNDDNDGNYLFIDEITVEDIPSCMIPSDLNAENITANSADLLWTSNGTESQWNIEYGLAGFTQTEGTMLSAVTSNPTSLEGLTENTEYEFYVQAHCGEGDESIWVGPFAFTTLCNTITVFPFNETFNTESSTKSCWTVLNANDDPDSWNLNQTSNPFEGDQCASFYSNYNYGNNDDYLITPQITLTGNQQFTYNFRVHYSWDTENFEILLSTTTNEAESFTTVLLENALYNNTSYQENTIDLSAYTGNVYIAIRMPNASNDGYYLYFDDITIEEIPACLNPTELNAENITANTADLSWTTGGASAWDLEIGEAGFTPTGTPTQININTNPYTATTLNSDTDYEFYVRDNCGVDGESEWEGPYAFTTLISCPVPTDITSSAITTNSVIMEWANGGTETQWNIEYGPTGFTQTEGTLLSAVNTNPTSIESLTENTAYDVYVQAYCAVDDQSEWVGPFSFRTLCNAITEFPFVETFNSESTTEACWTVLNENADADSWYLNNASYNLEGDQSASFKSDFNSGNNDDYLITPQISLTGNQKFKYNYRVRSASEPENFEILLSTTTNEAASFTTTLVENAQYSNTTYEENTIDLSAYTGDVYIAIHIPNDVTDGWYLYFDNLEIVEMSNDASLSDLTMDGSSVPDFDSETYSYNVELPYGAELIPNIAYTLNDDNATAVQTNATELPGSSIVEVTSEDGSTVLTYTVNFTIAANTDATLLDLTIDTETVDDFDAETLSYDIELAYGTTIVPAIAYTLNDEQATATQNNATELPGTTTIEVTAEDGTTTLLYSVNFTLALPSSDATLSNLSIEGTTVVEFNPDTYTYNLELAYGTETVPTVTYVLNDENASVVQSNATSLPGSTSVEVTAEDGSTVLTYTVNFTIAANTDATLSDLTIDTETVVDFDTETLNYAIELAYGTTVVPTVGFVMNDENASAVQTNASNLPGSTTVEVTAEDGITTLTYNINFTIAPPSTDANLNDLLSNGSTILGFDAMVYTYDVELPVGTETVPTVTYALNDENATANQINATSLPGSTTIEVTAEDGTTIVVYTINYTVAIALSDDASLYDLFIDDSTLGSFDPETFTYELILSYGTETVPTVTYQTNHINATVLQTDATELPGTTTIEVTAEDETTVSTYTINFIITSPSTDATLSDLSIEDETLVDFDAETLLYNVELAYGTTVVPTVAFVLNDVNATATQNDASALPGTTTIEVTAEDGTTVLTYSINFSIAPNTDATLSDLSIDAETLAEFDAATYTYEVELAYGTTTVPTVAFVINDENATATQTDATALPGTTTIEVTAEDGTTILTYTINFTITPNTDATLSDLSVDSETLADFDAETLNYDVELAYGTTIVPTVAFVLNDENATAAQIDASALPGTTTIEVTAEDGTTVLTYSINFSIAANTDATLSDLSIDAETLAEFDAETLNYDVELTYGTTIVPTVAFVLNDENATAVQTDATALPGTTTIEVTAEDGTTVLTYTINFTIAANTDATLSDLSIDAETLAEFDAATYTYEVELDYGTIIVPTVAFVLNDVNATATQTDASALPGTTTIEVTAEDGTTVLTYTINFTIAANTDASLTDLMVDGTTVADFDASVFTYDHELPSGTTIVPTVTYTTTDENATVVITDATELPGTTTIVVTAEDGSTELTYTIALTPDPTGINFVENSDEINIYPNPNHGVFNLSVNISTEKMVNIEVVNTKGQVISKMNDVNSNVTQSFNLSELATGIYFLKIYTGKRLITKKVNILN